MAESAVVLKQKMYKFEAENRRKLKEREQEAEKVREARDMRRFEIEREAQLKEREQREIAIRLMEEKKMLILRKQEGERKKREEEERRNLRRSARSYESRFAAYEPSFASSVDTHGEKKRKVSLSEFPMPPTQEVHARLYNRHPSQQSLHRKSSSSSFQMSESQRRRCISGADRSRLKTKASTNTFRLTRTRPPPKQEVPEEYYPYPESFRTPA
ncbi:hypothetical protein AAF712_005067 [Marasmius tenuissimus]|uniref:Uncharacterized protein n=1 Tax=Marasmius tenuissimus TaxID=585030 RepID=A0ABR3A4H6_9AGAR